MVAIKKKNESNKILYLEKFRSFEQLSEIFVSNQKKIDNADEVFIQIPLKNKILSILPDNVQFLDLIGYDENDFTCEEKNKFAITNSENIDCIFCIDNLRLKCNKHDIQNMWKIGIFADLFKKIVPKIVMLYIEYYDKKPKFGPEYSNETCKKEINISLYKFFDFLPEDQDEKQLLTSSSSESDSKIMKNVLLMDKTTVIPEIIKKVDYLILNISNNSKTLDNYSKDKLKRVLDDIKFYHDDHIKIQKYELILMLICEITQKLHLKFYRLNSHFKSTSKKLENLKLKLESLLKFYVDDISEKIDLDFIDEMEMYYYYSLGPEEMYDFSFIAEDLLRNWIIDLVKILKTISQEYNETLKNMKIKQQFIGFSNEYNNILLDQLVNEVDLKYKLILVLENNNDKNKNVLKKSLNELKEKIVDRVDSNYFPTDDQQNIQKDSKDYIDECKKLKEEVEKLVQKKYPPLNIKTEEVCIQEYKPYLFNERGSLSFPNISEPDIKEKLENGEIKLDDCFKKNWIKKVKADVNVKGLFEEGRHKSEIHNEGKFLVNELNNELKQFINQYNLETVIQFEIDRSNKKIMVECDKNEIDERIFELKINIANEKNCLYPIFISSVLREKRKNFRPNIFVEDLCKNGAQIEGFIVFLFIEAGHSKDRKSFEEDIKFYVDLQSKSSENSETKLKKNPVVLCLLPERNLGIGRKRKLMMLFAEYLNLPRFYICDDDIETFYQYDQSVHTRTMVKHGLNTGKALSFMSKVMDCSINETDNENNSNQTIESDIICDIICDLGQIKKKQDNDEIKKIISDLTKTIYENSDKLKIKKDIIRHYLNQLKLKKIRNFEIIEKKIEELVFKPREKTIGQIALWNLNNLFLGKNEHLNRLQGINKATHKISKCRYQVILYNAKAISGIHHVSDKAFFERPLDQKEKIDLLKKANKKDNEHGKRAAKLGYKFIDDAFVYYQILNGVTGCLIFYYAFKDFKNFNK